MRLIAFLQYAAVVIGSIGMVAAQFFALPKGFHLSLFVAGAGFALGGIDALVTRRMPLRPSDETYENYAGLPAVIVGLMVLAVGAGLIAAAYLLDNEHWHSTVNYLMRRPAPLLAAGGLFLIGVGILMMLNPLGRSGWVWRILVYFPRWLVGVLVVAAGLSVLALGAWEWLDPQAFRAFLKTLPALPKLSRV
ncbi:hypothetical protein AYO46_10260 [Betaproteobacteria bacterium SCGC AG-212-J23]|nr:hypothetical protein AYO46_10260 [Betaproteobacteria bacterium SCGC AG-212-J23]